MLDVCRRQFFEDGTRGTSVVNGQSMAARENCFGDCLSPGLSECLDMRREVIEIHRLPILGGSISSRVAMFSGLEVLTRGACGRHSATREVAGGQTRNNDVISKKAVLLLSRFFLATKPKSKV